MVLVMITAAEVGELKIRQPEFSSLILFLNLVLMSFMELKDFSTEAVPLEGQE